MSLKNSETTVQFWFKTCTLWQRRQAPEMLLTPFSTKSEKLFNLKKKYMLIFYFCSITVAVFIHSWQLPKCLISCMCFSEHTHTHTNCIHTSMWQLRDRWKKKKEKKNKTSTYILCTSDFQFCACSSINSSPISIENFRSLRHNIG